MQTATYRLGETYIRKRIRAPIVGALVFSVFATLMLLVVGITEDWEPWIAFTVGAFISVFMLFKNLRISRATAEQLPQVALEVTPESLRFIDSGGTYEIPVKSIKAIAIDRRSQEPRIVYLQRTGEETIPLEGMDRFDQFIAQLSRLVGTANVRELKWWQGPPK